MIKTLQGTVVSNKMKRTVVVAVERLVKHPKYGKYLRRRKRYLADDPTGHAIGDKVTIAECRPLSKLKHFKVVGLKPNP